MVYPLVPNTKTMGKSFSFRKLRNSKSLFFNTSPRALLVYKFLFFSFLYFDASTLFLFPSDSHLSSQVYAQSSVEKNESHEKYSLEKHEWLRHL